MNDDRRILKNLKSNNQVNVHEAFEEIYKKYYKLVFFVINKYVPIVEDSEDLTNEVFIKVFNNLNVLSEKRNIKYYIMTIAKNMSINFIRDASVKDKYLKRIEIEQTACRESHYLSILHSLKKYLNEDEVELIINHLVEGYTFKELSAKLNLSVNTLTSKYNRAIKKLAKNKEKILNE